MAADQPNDSRLFSFYLTAMHDLGRALQSQPRRVRMARPLREALYRILGTFAVGRGALLMLGEDGRRLELACAKGVRSGAELASTLTLQEVRRLRQATRPFRPTLPPGGLEKLAARLRAPMGKARLCWIVSLTTGSTAVGLLLLGDRVPSRPLTDLELEVLEEMAGLLALRVDEARVRRELDAQVRQSQRTQRQLQQIFLETVRVLAGVIDGPDPHGGPTHSARVASLAAEIGRRLKLPAVTCERLYVAGLLHDVGKQVISQDILEKRGELTEEERRQVQQHPVAAGELLAHIPFPWGDVAEIVRHHHERLDGRGYPDRLRGEQISIEARILAMAESFDAMTSDQPWRPRLALPKIVAQISENLGIQLEPRIVQALCDAVETGLDARSDPPEFAAHLASAFDPHLIRRMLRELRRQLSQPSQQPARIIDATPAGMS